MAIIAFLLVEFMKNKVAGVFWGFFFESSEGYNTGKRRERKKSCALFLGDGASWAQQRVVVSFPQELGSLSP